MSRLLIHEAPSEVSTLFSHGNGCGPHIPPNGFCAGVAKSLSAQSLAGEKPGLQKLCLSSSMFVFPLPSQEKEEKGFAGCLEGRLSE